MAEQAETDRLTAIFERQVGQMAELHKRETTHLRESHERAIAEVKEAHGDRVKELLAQNDAMLGAIGRLHSQNEELKKRASDLETRFGRAHEAMERVETNAKIEIERVRQSADESFERARKEAAAEIARLKEEVRRARGGRASK